MKLKFQNPVMPLLILLAGLVAAVFGPGCKSPNPNPGVSNRMASIIVTNHPSADIDTAIHVVFDRHEYVEGRSREEVLVFEKPASFMSGVVYSDWYSGGVWERVKVYQRPLAEGQVLVECDAYMVKEHDDPLFSEEKREYKTKQAHLQKILEEIALEAKNPSGTNAPPAKK